MRMDDGRRVLGVDPGPSGGAAIVAHQDGRWRLLWATAWTPTVQPLPLPYQPDAWAIEGLYVGQARQGVIAVAEDAGRWLERVGLAPLGRPMASRWRADLLRLPAATRAVDCDRAARATVEAVVDGALELDGHAVDAVCIALWAAGVRGRRR